MYLYKHFYEFALRMQYIWNVSMLISKFIKACLGRRSNTDKTAHQLSLNDFTFFCQACQSRGKMMKRLLSSVTVFSHRDYFASYIRILADGPHGNPM